MNQIFQRPEEDWCGLFDRLCSQSACDSGDLAAEFCRLSGKTGERDFTAAMRNLQNWRAGRNLPQRRNFRLLTEMLDLRRDPVLLERWQKLYAEAHAASAADRLISGSSSEGSSSEVLWQTEPGLLGVVKRLQVRNLAFLLGGALILSTMVWWEVDGGTSGTPDLPVIHYRQNVGLQVGETVTIHGKRGECGEAPPPEDVVRRDLPVVKFGRLEIGGLGRRFSHRCDGETPARAILYTGEQPGIDRFQLYGDPLVVTVSAD